MGGKNKNKNKNKSANQETLADAPKEDTQNDPPLETQQKVEAPQQTATTLDTIPEVKPELTLLQTENPTEPLQPQKTDEIIEKKPQEPISIPQVPQVVSIPEEPVSVPSEPIPVPEKVIQTKEVPVEPKAEEVKLEEDIQITIDRSADFENLAESTEKQPEPVQTVVIEQKSQIFEEVIVPVPEVKTEELKIEELKIEEPKIEEPKIEEPKIEESDNKPEPVIEQTQQVLPEIPVSVSTYEKTEIVESQEVYVDESFPINVPAEEIKQEKPIAPVEQAPQEPVHEESKPEPVRQQNSIVEEIKKEIPVVESVILEEKHVEVEHVEPEVVVLNNEQSAIEVRVDAHEIPIESKHHKQEPVVEKVTHPDSAEKKDLPFYEVNQEPEYIKAQVPAIKEEPIKREPEPEFERKGSMRGPNEPINQPVRLIEPAETKKQKTDKTDKNPNQKSVISVKKVGIAVGASLAVGSAAWFGLQNKNLTIIGALGALALSLVAQKN